ncbi:hypothetical protein GCM10008090_01090 [Arenicella chitinivorans]|uniref:Lipoprotein n=1 Tax=Arenicella chitinivorans TaxID=1329800 RepID=A0A918RFD5_9GAMM|nr:hypothetical protein [Arenicella chitinivorans]GGZ96644.1 hypothetical protein GCM10008090_01090 [Arenicella chitinivorans]
MTTRLLTILITTLVVSGCTASKRDGLEEIISDHRCRPEQRIEEIEFKSLGQALRHKLDLKWSTQANGEIAVRVEYPKKNKQLPIQDIYLSQSNDRLILTDLNPNEKIGLVRFSLPRSEILKSSLNLEYYRQAYCSSVIDYSLELRKAIEQES